MPMIAERKYNFSPGPAQLPDEVLVQAQEEILNWRSCGMSLMEVSHRGKEFKNIMDSSEADLRELLGIPANYSVMFLQGGASAQFATIPMNFLNGKSADYAVTGQWSKKAVEEAKKVGKVNICCDGAGSKYMALPQADQWKQDNTAAYLHLASNETIGGLRFTEFPRTSLPMVCDMSSDILSRPIDVSKFALIYAGAQKNIGPAGVTIVIVNNDFLATASDSVPTIFSYKNHAENKSVYNTPPTYIWYICGLVFQQLKRKGLANVHAENEKKAAMLYNYIDNSGFYKNPIEPANRSIMNIPFTLKDEKLDDTFLKLATAAGLLNLQGHRSVGGMRASIYNAMPIAGVEALISFMKDFAGKNG